MSLCQNCHAGCCRAFAIPLTGVDILRIERDLGLDFWDFVCRWADHNGTIAQSYAPQFYFEDDPETPYVICSTHTDSTFLPGTTKCRFLVECPPDAEHPLGQARCGIYGQRPLPCRVFPSKLNESAELAILTDVPSCGRSSGEPAYNLCPTEWTASDLDPLDTMQNLVVAKYEMTFFHQLAAIWNRQPRSWAIFPEFLRVVYKSRVIDPKQTQAPAHRFPAGATDTRQQHVKAA